MKTPSDVSNHRGLLRPSGTGESLGQFLCVSLVYSICTELVTLVELSHLCVTFAHTAFIQRLLNPSIGRLTAVVGFILLKAIGAEDAIWLDLHGCDDAVAVIRCVLRLYVSAR
jgi:hypothetical protein